MTFKRNCKRCDKIFNPNTKFCAICPTCKNDKEYNAAWRKRCSERTLIRVLAYPKHWQGKLTQKEIQELRI
jgi:RecJ-like exonuclease